MANSTNNALISGYATVKARGVKKLDYTLTAHKVGVKAAGYEMSDEKKRKREMMKPGEEKISTDDIQAENEKRFANSIIRSKNAVIQLGANNLWEYFVTLTIRREGLDFSAYDLEEVKKKILTFFRNYAQRSGAKSNFKYLLIPEKHKDGAWHFHGLLSGINENDLFINENGYLDFKPFRERFGWVSFGRRRRKGDNKCEMSRIRDLTATACYISKYISKSMFGNVEFQKGMHLYFASKGLKKDEVLVKGTLCASPDFFKEQTIYENEFCIKVFSNEPEPLLEKVIPLVNRYKNGHNIPEFYYKAPMSFIERYGRLAYAFGYRIYDYDVRNRTEKYYSFVKLLEQYKLTEYEPPKISPDTFGEIFGSVEMPVDMRELPDFSVDMFPKYPVIPSGVQMAFCFES